MSANKRGHTPLKQPVKVPIEKEAEAEEKVFHQPKPQKISFLGRSPRAGTIIVAMLCMIPIIMDLKVTITAKDDNTTATIWWTQTHSEINIPVNALLLLGAMLENRWLLIPWLVVATKDIIKYISDLLRIMYMIQHFHSWNTKINFLVSIPASIGLYIAASSYMIYVVIRYYQQL